MEACFGKKLMDLALGLARISEGVGILLILAAVLYGAGNETVVIGPLSLAVKSPILAKAGLLLLGCGLLIDGTIRVFTLRG